MIDGTRRSPARREGVAGAFPEPRVVGGELLMPARITRFIAT